MGEEALKVARHMAAGRSPREAASRTGAAWDEKRRQLTLPFLGATASVTFPDLNVAIDDRRAPSHIAALVLYHIALSDGSTPTGEWISFAQLPDASFYVTAFRGYTGARIARHFSTLHASSLGNAVGSLGGERLPGLADNAWFIPALPHVPLALLWWDSDDEFEARAELLFDATASHHLTTDGCALLGSVLTSQLVAQAG